MRRLTDEELAEPDITLRFRDKQASPEIIRELEPYGIHWGGLGGVHSVTIPAYKWRDVEALMNKQR